MRAGKAAGFGTKARLEGALPVAEGGDVASSDGLQGGLASAPGTTRPWTEADRAQEPIANGRHSCRLEPGQSDPLPYRVPPCAEVGPARRGTGRPRPAVSP